MSGFFIHSDINCTSEMSSNFTRLASHLKPICIHSLAENPLLKKVANNSATDGVGSVAIFNHNTKSIRTNTSVLR